MVEFIEQKFPENFHIDFSVGTSEVHTFYDLCRLVDENQILLLELEKDTSKHIEFVLDNAKYHSKDKFNQNEGLKLFGIGRTYENNNYTLRQALIDGLRSNIKKRMYAKVS